MSKPRIVMTSTSGWEFDYLKRIIEAVELKNPVVRVGCKWFKPILIVEWEVADGR